MKEKKSFSDIRAGVGFMITFVIVLYIDGLHANPYREVVFGWPVYV